MKKATLILPTLIFAASLAAQDYRITTDQKDDFSKALVQLLNCAATRFKDCTGDSLRSTWLMGDDYRLTIPFPGSTIGIVRQRDWNKNAYVEFRGYKDVAGLNKGLKTLIDKIKKALGKQLVPPVITGNQKTITQFSMMAIQDENGHFTANIELLPGSSGAEPYLLGPEREEETATRKQRFILLKVHGGIPSYQYYIKDGIAPPDRALHTLLQRLMKEAVTDFDSLPIMQSAARRGKKVDTLQVNGYTVYLDKRGSHRSANIVFDVNADSASVDSMMRWCRQAIDAAVGSSYVYHPYNYDKTKSIIYYQSYYSPLYRLTSPRIDLIYSPEQYRKPVPVIIKIQGIPTHPVKRSRSLNEEDD